MEEQDLSSELSDFNSKRAGGTQSGSLVNSRRSHILESIGSDTSGSDPGGDLPSEVDYSKKTDGGTSHPENPNPSMERATSNISDWPWG